MTRLGIMLGSVVVMAGCVGAPPPAPAGATAAGSSGSSGGMAASTGGRADTGTTAGASADGASTGSASSTGPGCSVPCGMGEVCVDGVCQPVPGGSTSSGGVIGTTTGVDPGECEQCMFASCGDVFASCFDGGDRSDCGCCFQALVVGVCECGDAGFCDVGFGRLENVLECAEFSCAVECGLDACEPMDFPCDQPEEACKGGGA